MFNRVNQLTTSIAVTRGGALWAGTDAALVFCVKKGGPFWDNYPDTLQAEISNHYVRFAQMIDVKTDNALYIYI